MGYIPHPPPIRFRIDPAELSDPFDPTPAEYACILEERGLRAVSKVGTTELHLPRPPKGGTGGCGHIPVLSGSLPIIPTLNPGTR